MNSTKIGFQCEWRTLNKHGKVWYRCRKVADFKQQVYCDKFWYLCARHKREVLQSYNDDFRAREAEKWKPCDVFEETT